MFGGGPVRSGGEFVHLGGKSVVFVHALWACTGVPNPLDASLSIASEIRNPSRQFRDMATKGSSSSLQCSVADRWAKSPKIGKL
jgi:hypothetical protein